MVKRNSKYYNVAKKTKSIFKEIIVFVLIIVCSFLFTRYVLGLTCIKGSSMYDTYRNGQFVLTNKFSDKYERFDVITFDSHYDGTFIKRIIGLPGEKVRIDADGVIYINDEVLKEDYGTEKIKEAGVALNGITLKEDEYFVLGDNRNASLDSRFEIGPITKDDIIGIVWFSK